MASAPLPSPTPDALLAERISDFLLSNKRAAELRPVMLELCLLAVPAVLRAGAAGNVTCKEAGYDILRLLEKHGL